MSSRMQQRVKKGQSKGGLFAYSTIDNWHDDKLDLENQIISNLLAFLAKSVGYTMYFNPVINQPDSHQFIDVIIKEVDGHTERKHWAMITRSEVAEREILSHQYSQ